MYSAKNGKGEICGNYLSILFCDGKIETDFKEK